jgi:hypothetical protein
MTAYEHLRQELPGLHGASPVPVPSISRRAMSSRADKIYRAYRTKYRMLYLMSPIARRFEEPGLAMWVS